MYFWFFQFVGWLLVGGVWGGFYQYKWFVVFQVVYYVVIYCGVIGQCGFVFIVVLYWIVVLGDEIQCFCQLLVVVIVEIFYKVGSYWQGGICCFQWSNFMVVEIGYLSGVKVMLVKIEIVD